MRSPSSTKLYGLLAGVALLGAAVPAWAQVHEEDIIVTGHYGQVPDNVQTVSIPVSYADLDLSTLSGQDELKHRLRLTSRYLCSKLGENDTAPGLVPSCQDAAYQDALQRAGTVWQHFAPRGTAWVAGPRWAPPYPEDWASRYP